MFKFLKRTIFLGILKATVWKKKPQLILIATYVWNLLKQLP